MDEFSYWGCSKDKISLIWEAENSRYYSLNLKLYPPRPGFTLRWCQHCVNLTRSRKCQILNQQHVKSFDILQQKQRTHKLIHSTCNILRCLPPLSEYTHLLAHTPRMPPVQGAPWAALCGTPALRTVCPPSCNETPSSVSGVFSSAQSSTRDSMVIWVY